MKGGTGNATFVGGAGHDTLQAGSGSNLFEFFKSTQTAQYGGGAGGTHVIQGFNTAAGGGLYVEGYTLAQLQSLGDIKVVGGNTVITLADRTSITLVGVTNLSANNLTTTAT